MAEQLTGVYLLWIFSDICLIEKKYLSDTEICMCLIRRLGDLPKQKCLKHRLTAYCRCSSNYHSGFQQILIVRWGVGVVMYEMMVGRLPFYNRYASHQPAIVITAVS